MENQKKPKWGVVVLQTADRQNYFEANLDYDSVQLVGLDDYNVTLEQLYEWTKCRCIEIVRFSNGLMCIDDNGKCKGKPINTIASVLYGNPNDFIVGDAVLGCSTCPDKYAEPDFYAMPYDEAVKLYLEMLDVQLS